METWLVAVIFFVVFNFIQAEAGKEFKIPSYIDLCYRDDPKVSECLLKDIQKLLPIFKNGSEEFNLEPIDPMYFDVLDLHYKSGIVGGSLNITDAYVHGLSASEVKSVRPKLTDPNKFIMDMDIVIPVMNLRADYRLKGNVIKIPVDIKGRIDMLFDSINVTYHVTGEVKTIDNYEYLIIDKFSWRFLSDGIHKATLQNKDIVEGKPALNRVVRTVVNTSWKLLIDQMLPAILPESDKKLTLMFSKFFKSYPYDVIFPKHTKKQGEKGSETDKNKDEHKKEDKKKEENIKEDKKKEENIKDNKKKEENIKNDKKKEENIKEDKKKEENIKQDKKKEENIKEDKKKDENIKEDKKKEENIKEDKKNEENIKEDKKKDENIKEDKKNEENIKEDKKKEDS